MLNEGSLKQKNEHIMHDSIMRSFITGKQINGDKIRKVVVLVKQGWE